MTISHSAYGGIKGVLMSLTVRGKLIAIYGAPPCCNYCNKLGLPPKHNPGKTWLGNAWIGLTIDHIIPRCLDGMTILENLQILCEECNQAKSIIEQHVFYEEWRNGEKW